MSGGDDPCASGEAVGDKEFLDSPAVQWFGSLFDFITVFWYENAGLLNEIPPLDVKLNAILRYIPMEIAFISSWFGEQLAEWESSVSKELIADVRSAVLQATYIVMICLRFIGVCKEEAEKEKNPEILVEEPPSFVLGSSGKHEADQATEQSKTMEFKSYQLLPCSENINTEYVTYEDVKKILEDVESYCKNHKKLIIEDLFGEKSSNREYRSTGEESPSGKYRAKSSGNLSEAKKKESFNKLIKNMALIFSSTETSHDTISSKKKRRSKRLVYAKPKWVRSDNKEFDTLVLESKCAADGTSCATQTTDSIEDSAKITASSRILSSNTSEGGSLGISVFNIYTTESEDHVLLSVPADHTLEWGNEAEAPQELLLLIRMQNCAIETWEMITEAKIGNQTLMSDSNKAIIKRVFDTLYKNLQVLKACVFVGKSSHHSKVSPFFYHVESVGLQNTTDTDPSESQSDEDSNPTFYREILSPTYGVKKGSLSLLKCASVNVRKEGESIQLIARVLRPLKPVAPLEKQDLKKKRNKSERTISAVRPTTSNK